MADTFDMIQRVDRLGKTIGDDFDVTYRDLDTSEAPLDPANVDINEREQQHQHDQFYHRDVFLSAALVPCRPVLYYSASRPLPSRATRPPAFFPRRLVDRERPSAKVLAIRPAIAAWASLALGISTKPNRAAGASRDRSSRARCLRCHRHQITDAPRLRWP